MRPRNVKFQNHNENADRHLIASALRWRPFYTPGDFTVTVFHQRLHQAADLLDVVRHRPLLDAKLVRHLLLGGSVIEQTEDPAVLGLYLAEHGDQVFQERFVDNIFLKRSLCGRL